MNEEQREELESTIDGLVAIINEYDANNKKLAAIVRTIVDMCRSVEGISLVEMTGAIDIANKYIFETFKPGSLKRNQDSIESTVNYIS